MVITPDNSHFGLDIGISFDGNHEVTIGAKLRAVGNLKETVPNMTDIIIHFDILVHESLNGDILTDFIGRYFDVTTLEIIQHLERGLLLMVVQKIVGLIFLQFQLNWHR